MLEKIRNLKSIEIAHSIYQKKQKKNWIKLKIKLFLWFFQFFNQQWTIETVHNCSTSDCEQEALFFEINFSFIIFLWVFCVSARRGENNWNVESIQWNLKSIFLHRKKYENETKNRKKKVHHKNWSSWDFFSSSSLLFFVVVCCISVVHRRYYGGRGRALKPRHKNFFKIPQKKIFEIYIIRK